jgi:hypothetical protein
MNTCAATWYYNNITVWCHVTSKTWLKRFCYNGLLVESLQYQQRKSGVFFVVKIPNICEELAARVILSLSCKLSLECCFHEEVSLVASEKKFSISKCKETIIRL